MPSRKAKNQATLIQCEPSCHFFLFLRQTLLGIIGWLKTKPMRFFSYSLGNDRQTTVSEIAASADAFVSIGENVMQLYREADMHVSQAETRDPSVSTSKPKRSRKVTVRLTDELYNRFSTATERPGLGKSILVEAALERFLSPAPSVEDIVHERFDDMDHRFDRLEHNVRMMAETIALHARYHLSVTPPLPPAQQQEAAALGDERFKVLAEQVDRRVRSGRPLMQETIGRLNSTERSHPKPTMSEGDPKCSDIDRNPPAPDVDPSFSAAAGEGGSNSYFRRLPN